MIPLPLRSEIIQAACDGVYLLDRGYSKDSTIKFIANHHVLLKEERNLLFRGICASNTAKKTRKKIITSFDNKCLSKLNSIGIDGFNLLITFETMLKGESVILCYDGLIRDICAIHGRYKQSQWTRTAIEKIIVILEENLNEKTINVYLDQLVSRSGEIAAHFRQSLDKSSLKGTVYCCRSPDHEILENELIISHDSIVAQKAEFVLDLPNIFLIDAGNTSQAVNLVEIIHQNWQKIQNNVLTLDTNLKDMNND